MKAAHRYFLVPLFLFPILFFTIPTTASQAQAPAQAPRPWQVITVPSTVEVAANFISPPREYGAIQQFQSWNGADQAEVRRRISFDLDQMAANGIFMINL